MYNVNTQNKIKWEHVEVFFTLISRCIILSMILKIYSILNEFFYYIPVNVLRITDAK
jgi:hypothetical protein